MTGICMDKMQRDKTEIEEAFLKHTTVLHILPAKKD